MKYTVHIYALYYYYLLLLFIIIIIINIYICIYIYLYIYTYRMILPSHPVTQGDSCDGSPLAATIET